MGKEKGKQSKLEKIKSFKEGCISQGKEFSPELDSGLELGFDQTEARFNREPSSLYRQSLLQPALWVSMPRQSHQRFQHL